MPVPPAFHGGTGHALLPAEFADSTLGKHTEADRVFENTQGFTGFEGDVHSRLLRTIAAIQTGRLEMPA